MHEEVPVLIVGGGGAGLTASMLLAREGVDHLLVSARPGTSVLPKAHVLNQKSMEILEDCGVADEIAERGTPADQMAATAYYAGFAGAHGDSGRRIARLESWGAGGENELWRAASPWRQQNLPQIRLEPVLKAGAERLSPGKIRFNHELTELSPDEEGVDAVVRDNDTGESYTVPGRFLLIAGEDGEAWCEAARELSARADLPLDAVRIGHLDGDLYDPRCTWLRRREIASDGALLVRPDRFVAWRSLAGSESPEDELADALGRILAKPVGSVAVEA
jgi:hypothetical protein